MMASPRTNAKDPTGLHLLNILEVEFDSLLRDLHESLSSLRDASQETQTLALDAGACADSLAPVFAQVVGKATAAAHAKQKLQVKCLYVLMFSKACSPAHYEYVY